MVIAESVKLEICFLVRLAAKEVFKLVETRVKPTWLENILPVASTDLLVV